MFSLSLRNPFALTWLGSRLLANENGVHVDRVISITRGMNFGYDGSDNTIRMNALYVWGPPAVAPVGMALVDDSGFPPERRGRPIVPRAHPASVICISAAEKFPHFAPSLSPIPSPSSAAGPGNRNSGPGLHAGREKPRLVGLYPQLSTVAP